MMIPFKVKTFSFLLACACSTAGMAQVVNDSPVRQVKISGYVGTRIADCIERRVKAQDVDHLVEPFRHQNEKSRWQSEFWGKWIQGAIASYRYNRDPETVPDHKGCGRIAYGNTTAERLYRELCTGIPVAAMGCLGAQVYFIGIDCLV